MRRNSEYNDSERPAIELLKKLGYDYYDASKQDEERDSGSDPILINRLQKALKRINPWLDDHNLKTAVRKITKPRADSLMAANKEIHHLLQGPATSVQHREKGKKQDKSIHFIDYNNIDNNDFLAVNQMLFKGKEAKSIPDITLFVNGLPIAVIECKSPNIQNADSEAINDLEHYQENSPKLFRCNQICAGIFKVGGKYGAIGAPEIHYNPYKCKDNEQTPITKLLNGSRDITPQDILLYSLFHKKHLLDIIRNFIVFETVEGKTVKKLPRCPQIRAVNKAIEKLESEDKGGVVWHTQGSGKSLSMVFLAKKLRREEQGFKNPTIIVMTDRVDLDDQITRTFKNCGFPNPIQAGSIRGLGRLLRDPYGKTIMTTIQKFQETDEKGNALRGDDTCLKNGSTVQTKRYIEPGGQLVKITTVKDREGRKISESREVIDVPQLSVKENVFVFVDEAHRSHYGFLAGFMRRALPNAKFIAFTGTPIDKENKSTLAEFYGGRYLDTYTIKESAADGATLPIYYNAALPEVHVNKEHIDRKFESEFQDCSPAKKERLRQKASELATYLNARDRIDRVAADIIRHYGEKIYPNGFKAMVVCHSREAAVNYKEAFDELLEQGRHDFKSRVIMSLDTKKDPERFCQLATHPKRIGQAVEEFKLPFGDENLHAKDGKKQHDNTAFLIVCDMLLTGFDVPVVQVMYLDKLLTEHNLLQAIARVNRTRDGKKAGFIVDYCGITRHLSKALAMFSDDLAPGDVMEKTDAEISRLQNRHRRLVAFFNPIEIDRKKQRAAYIDKAVRCLEPEDLRDEFKLLLKAFDTSIDILLPSPAALAYEYDFTLYNEIKYQAANTYVDDSLRVTKGESRKIQQLVDDHLTASGVRYLLEKPVSIIDREKFDEEIHKSLGPESQRLKRLNRIKHTIKINLHKDPEFYKPLSERLEKLIAAYEEGRIEQMELFDGMAEIEGAIIDKDSEGRKLGFHTEGEFAVYNTLKKHFPEDAEVLTRTLLQILTPELGIHDWSEKEQVKKTMRRNIKKTLAGKLPDNLKDSLPGAIVNVLTHNREPREV